MRELLLYAALGGLILLAVAVIGIYVLTGYLLGMTDHGQ